MNKPARTVAAKTVGQSRIPGPVWAKVKSIAKKANRSASQQVVVFCKEGIERERAKK